MQTASKPSSSPWVPVGRRDRPAGDGADLFENSEPLGFEAGDANLYRYVGNSPTNALDPSGLYIEKDHVSTSLEDFKKELVNTMLDYAASQGWDRDKDGVNGHAKQIAEYLRRNEGGADKMKNKYFYTKEGGWVDLKHLLSSSLILKYTLAPRGVIIKAGLELEIKQALEGSPSGFGPEDLPSNKYGIMLADYIDKDNLHDLPNAIEKFVNEKLGGFAAPPMEDIDQFNRCVNFTDKPILDPWDLQGARKNASIKVAQNLRVKFKNPLNGIIYYKSSGSEETDARYLEHLWEGRKRVEDNAEGKKSYSK